MQRSGSSRACFLAALLALAAFVCNAQSTKAGWKKFTSRSGWSIDYPHDWGTSSCHACPDPHEAGIWVAFTPRAMNERKGGTVTVAPFSNDSAQSARDNLRGSAQDYARINHMKLLDSEVTVLDGQRALKTHYGHSDVAEIEVIFTIDRHQQLLEIAFVGPSQAGNYPVYQHMLSTFRF